MKRVLMRVVEVQRLDPPSIHHAFQIVDNDLLEGRFVLGAELTRVTVYPKTLPLGSTLSILVPEPNEKDFNA